MVFINIALSPFMEGKIVNPLAYFHLFMKIKSLLVASTVMSGRSSIALCAMCSSKNRVAKAFQVIVMPISATRTELGSPTPKPQDLCETIPKMIQKHDNSKRIM